MEYLKYTPEMARDWKNAINSTDGYMEKRVWDSLNESQLVSKMWLVEEMLNLKMKPVNVSLLAGWFAQYIVPLLFDNFKSIECIENFEMDRNIKSLAYKFNTRYKNDERYRIRYRNIMFEKCLMIDKIEKHDVVINCSCEHMYPMSRFRELEHAGVDNNEAVYILQSSNDTQYDDHINCVNSPDELAEQARILEIMYKGEKLLPNGMIRFMVIGR